MDSHTALQRILGSPELERAVPRLPPELLHRVIQHVGLEDSAALVALATPEQLTRVFDLDLWQPAQPGLDEQFDAGRFGTWLQVLLDGAGAAGAARTLAALAPDLVTTGLAQHVRVFDYASVATYTTLDGQQAGGRSDDDVLTREIGGYRLLARRDDAWDAIVETLLALETAHGDCFHRLMSGCRALSNSRPEESGMDELLDNPEQVMFDLALDRERRREQQGYVTPAQARAFLDLARRPPAEKDAILAANPVASAYFRSIEAHAMELAQDAAGSPNDSIASDAPDAAAEELAAVVEVLFDAGILGQPPRALPAASSAEPSRVSRIEAALRIAVDRDPGAYAARSAELGFLANTLVSGCSVQARPFTPQEASDGALAVCNLGLEHWPVDPPDDLLVRYDLVAVFHVGWAVLYEQVSVRAARRLAEALSAVQPRDRMVHIGLAALRASVKRALEAGRPWDARGRLDVLTSLDLPAWAVLLGLLDECPVMHAVLAAPRDATVLSVSPTAFEFIAERAHLARIDEFLEGLPQTLRGTSEGAARS
jgi:hypothetical protein